MVLKLEQRVVEDAEEDFLVAHQKQCFVELASSNPPSQFDERSKNLKMF